MMDFMNAYYKILMNKHNARIVVNVNDSHLIIKIFFII